MIKIIGEHKNDVWVFGYGSLMWKPGFDYLESQGATVTGYHRDMCILSYVFRGTPEVPGLVMGLNPGGSCQGLAFKVSGQKREDVFAYLHEREMINDVYIPSWVSCGLENGEEVQAYTFVAMGTHAQHVGHLTQQEKIELILQGRGKGGTSVEYLENCCRHLRLLGITDPALEGLLSLTLQK